MTRDQVAECLTYYNTFFPEKGLPPESGRTFAVKLLPLDFQTAMRAIDAACTTDRAAEGFLPAWGAVEVAYRDAELASARERGWMGVGTGYASGPQSPPANALGPGDAPDADAREVLTNVRERWREFAAARTPEQMELHMANLRERPLRDSHPRTLYECRVCKQGDGWVRDEQQPVGTALRLAPCPACSPGRRAS